MRLLGLICSLLIFVAASRANSPTPERAKAKALYESGTTHYNLSEYSDALKDFKEAYRIMKDPIFLYNIAQCHRQLHELDEAVKLYRAYRREYPNAPNRAEVDRTIEQMETAIAEKRAQEQSATAAPTPVVPPPVVAPAPLPAAEAPIVVAAPPPEKPRPIYKKGWFWGAMVGGIVVVGAGITVGVVLGKGKASTTQLQDLRF